MKSLFIKWLVITGGLLVAVFCFLSHEIWTIGSEWVSSADAGQPTLLDSDLGSVREVKFVDESASIAQVRVTKLAVVSHSGNSATVGIKLASSAPTQVYPSLRIFMKSGDRINRTVVLGPTQYAHGSNLTDEEVRIPLTLEAGETGFTAEAISAAAGDVK
ncbi:hypothetical protein [Paraburkholderia dioscoreae]|uniref:Uncharacterized protein n=1 Tax=Paraburkholderia dioscoreae TaxID=2604047 RepID=A0A5Q4ZHU9_9BURK|nr:hypothetical protein [Paraburkholderia dioscoreae]VVD30967.1 conserved protein of unknown function [Paraburkholderia dioscoreae]